MFTTKTTENDAKSRKKYKSHHVFSDIILQRIFCYGIYFSSLFSTQMDFLKYISLYLNKVFFSLEGLNAYMSYTLIFHYHYF